MKSFEIVEFYVGKKATVYSIHFEGEAHDETNKFLMKFFESHKADIQKFVPQITKMADKRGFRDYDIRFEGKYCDALIALPNKRTRSELRLYGLRWSNWILILFTGGIKEKDVRAYQEVPELDKITKEIEEISNLIEERIGEDIFVEDQSLEGDLKFEL